MAFTQQILRNSTLEIQTALGSNLTITGISNASEAVFTASNSLAAGDLVVLSGIVGMPKLNNMVVRVKSPSGTAFTAEGLDTSSTAYYGTYSSGGIGNEVTTLASFTNVTSLELPDNAPTENDVTAINDTAQQIVYGMDGTLKGTVSVFADPGQTSMQEVRTAARLRTARVFRLTTQGGTVWIWNATNLSGGAGLSASVGGVGTATINLTLGHEAQYFAS